MISSKSHSVTLNQFKADQLNGKRLAYVVEKSLHCGAEKMHVEKSFDEPGKHIVSITFVSLSDAKPGEEFGLIHSNKVSLDQDTVDRIETSEGGTEYKRYCKMAGCYFVVLVDIFVQARR
ncbi:MAG: hypothetical protein ABSA83_18720 [Verrucomicrobiota bacterium]|jgi:hypothetical protein